jgi:hypothetical protein
MGAACERLAQRALADWSKKDLKDLTRLLRRFNGQFDAKGRSIKPRAAPMLVSHVIGSMPPFTGAMGK